MSLLPWTTQQWFDDVGDPLQFGKIYFYQAGTLVPKVTYKKADQSEANEHPIILDAAGRAKVWIIDGEAYDEVDHDENDNVLRSLQGIVVNASSGGTVVDRKVATDDADATPGVLVDKTISSSSVEITVVDSGGRKLQFTVDEAWLSSWLTINYPFPADDHLVISDGTTQTAGTLAQKITDALGTVFAVNGAKQLVIPLQSYLSLVGGGTVTGPTTFTNVTIPDQFKIKAGSGDIAGWYVDKIQPGTGIEFSETVDGVNGVVLHISKTDEGALTAPLHEVITGDGAGGVLSSPSFTAVGGDVATNTVTSSATGPAITAPNGSVLASGVAEMAQSAWAGTGAAWFGPEGHNPATDDGTLSGLISTEFVSILRGPHGGSATLGTGLGNIAAYDDQVAADVPTSAPAFHQLDGVILTGASYSSTYHATICFFGTGTAFVVPAGGSLNRTIRLSNSSAASIAVTGVATAFTLAPGQSRDLFWSEEVTPKWY
jgi:hypothetical protein